MFIFLLIYRGKGIWFVSSSTRRAQGHSIGAAPAERIGAELPAADESGPGTAVRQGLVN